MCMELKWSILIATLGRRSTKLRRLLGEFAPQMPTDRSVEVIAYRNHGEKPLAEIRQALVEDAQGQYISFVDDDDHLPDYYIPEVLTRLDGVQYVGWQMQAYQDGQPLKPTFHSLRYGRWYEDNSGYYRDVSHLNPVLIELARKVDFRRGLPPEDVSWVDQMRHFVTTEHYIDRVMYHYYASSADSAWRPGTETTPEVIEPLPAVRHPWFRWHPAST